MVKEGFIAAAAAGRGDSKEREREREREREEPEEEDKRYSCLLPVSSYSSRKQGTHWGWIPLSLSLSLSVLLLFCVGFRRFRVCLGDECF